MFVAKHLTAFRSGLFELLHAYHDIVAAEQRRRACLQCLWSLFQVAQCKQISLPDSPSSHPHYSTHKKLACKRLICLGAPHYIIAGAKPVSPRARVLHINQSINQSLTHSMNQWMNQLNRPVTLKVCSINQSINQSIEFHFKISFLPELLRSSGSKKFLCRFWVMRKQIRPWDGVGDAGEGMNRAWGLGVGLRICYLDAICA